MTIWASARVPTTSQNNCYRKVHQLILDWNKCHNAGEVSAALAQRLNTLLDLKPKLKGKPTEEAELENLRDVMRQAADIHRRKTVESGVEQYDWEADYNFYIYQYKVYIIHYTIYN